MVKSMEERFLQSTYLDKGTRFSASALTKPDYQLWVINHSPKDEVTTKQVGFKSAIGSAWHEFCEKNNEVGVVKEVSYVKEFEGTTIGGTADELVWLGDKWQIRDHKTKGVYSAKKFLGIGTKAEPHPMPENEKEIKQLSIYRWLFKDMFEIADEAIIYLWVMGHTKRESFPEVSEVPLKLIDMEETEQMISEKIKVALADDEPVFDCETWLCDYCDVQHHCPKQQHLHNPFG
ncbi:hypothetical protein CRP143_gp28 [Roseobacter phage CRP-143]|nr:hypothetical protein CRP143_gp28 [Roseobacter phage CRP-143]